MTLQPMGDILDLDRFASMLGDFSIATGIATVVVDVRGTPVLPPCAFTDFCRAMRDDPVRSQLCEGCDAHGGLQSLMNGTPQVYRCHAGLVDFSVPVASQGNYVGAILCGQVRLPETELPRYLTPDSGWRGSPDLERLYDAIPLTSRRRVEAAAGMLVRLCRQLETQSSSSLPFLPELDMSLAGQTIPVIDQPQAKLVSLTMPSSRTASDRDNSLEEPALANSADAPPRREMASETTAHDIQQALQINDLPMAIDAASALLASAYEAHHDVRETIGDIEQAVIAAATDSAPRAASHLEEQILRRRKVRGARPDRYKTQLYVEGLLGLVIDAVRKEEPERQPNLHDLLNEIAKAPGKSMFLVDAAEFLHWSPSYLSKLFKNTTGCTFLSYINSRRISRACLMLSSTQLSIKRIAADLDFHQVNYFSRVFRVQMGMTPSEYRAKYA